MGAAIELLTGIVTAPSTTLTALTMASGNSLTVRNAALDSEIRLLNAWTDNQTAGTFRIRSPQMHDNVQGIRLPAPASQVQPLMPHGARQRLHPQDQLTAELSGSGTAGDIETACMLLYYADLVGVAGRFIDPEQLMARIVDIVTVENTIATGTSGGYSGEEALNAEFDLLHANTDYALLGYQVSAECAAVRWRGVDSGNLGVGGPGTETEKHLTAEWFVALSKYNALPLIPVFNSANKAGILIDCAQDENGTDVTVTSIFAQLRAA